MDGLHKQLAPIETIIMSSFSDKNNDNIDDNVKNVDTIFPRKVLRSVLRSGNVSTILGKGTGDFDADSTRPKSAPPSRRHTPAVNKSNLSFKEVIWSQVRIIVHWLPIKQV